MQGHRPEASALFKEEGFLAVLETLSWSVKGHLCLGAGGGELHGGLKKKKTTDVLTTKTLPYKRAPATWNNVTKPHTTCGQDRKMDYFFFSCFLLKKATWPYF